MKNIRLLNIFPLCISTICIPQIFINGINPFVRSWKWPGPLKTNLVHSIKDIQKTWSHPKSKISKNHYILCHEIEIFWEIYCTFKIEKEYFLKNMIYQNRNLVYFIKKLLGYSNNNFKWKVTESLLIKDIWITLNTHKKSVPLKSFNWYVVCLLPLPCEWNLETRLWRSFVYSDFFFFYYFNEIKLIHRCVLQRTLLTSCISFDKT